MLGTRPESVIGYVAISHASYSRERMDFDPKERIGVFELALALAREFQWIFREQPISDVGIDGHIELVTHGKAQGKLIAVQVKTGDSYLQRTKEGVVFYGDNKHLDYWLNHSLPVLLVVYTPGEQSLRWVDIRPDNIERTSKRWKVVLPENHKVDQSSLDELLAVFDRAPRVGEFEKATSIARQEQPGFDGHVSSIVNDIAADLQIYNWYGWVEEACWEHIPALHDSFLEGARSARVKLPSWIFPRDSYSDIVLSASDMIHKANYAVDLLLERGEYEDQRKTYRGVHAYKRYHNPNYDSDSRDHIAWAKTYVTSFKEFVKAANLFCEVVREQLDPSFLLKMGKLMFSDDFASWSEVPEYTLPERWGVLEPNKSARLTATLSTEEKINAGMPEVDLRLTLKPVMEFNAFLGRAFGNGPCTCIRCKVSGGDETGYEHQHTFNFEGFQANRRFASTSSSDILQILRKAWWSYTKSEMAVSGNLPLDVIKEFVEPGLHTLLVPSFVASGLVKDIGGDLQLRIPS